MEELFQQPVLKNKIIHKSKKSITIAVVLIILISAGFFAWQYYKITDTFSNEDKSSENVISSEWKTYRNEEFGFQYPQKFSVKEDNGKVLLFEIEYVNNLRLSFEKNNKPLNKLVPRFNAEDVVIGNMESKFIFLAEHNQVNKNYYIYIDDSSTFIIKATITEYGVMSFKEQSELLDMILFTFKFVK